jgi:hypothetical protein
MTSPTPLTPGEIDAIEARANVDDDPFAPDWIRAIARQTLTLVAECRRLRRDAMALREALRDVSYWMAMDMVLVAEADTFDAAESRAHEVLDRTEYLAADGGDHEV